MEHLSECIFGIKEVSVKPDLDDVKRVLILDGRAPFYQKQAAAGGFEVMEGDSYVMVLHRPSVLSPDDAIVEDDLRITQYARALKAAGYLVEVEPIMTTVDGRSNHFLRIRLRD